jgi:hypothetical protein
VILDESQRAVLKRHLGVKMPGERGGFFVAQQVVQRLVVGIVESLVL